MSRIKYRGFASMDKEKRRSMRAEPERARMRRGKPIPGPRKKPEAQGK